MDAVTGLQLYRLVVGATFVAAPGPATRAWLGPRPDLPLQRARYAVGARDVVLSTGGLVAGARGGDPAPWLRVAAASEAVDALVTLRSGHAWSWPRRVAGAAGALAAAAACWRAAGARG